MQPNAEMSYCHVGFDLKAARQICDQATFQLTGAEIDEDLKILIDQANMLPAALDEIERLQADIITHDDAWHNDRAANAKRIAELEASLQRERAMAFSKIQRQRHAIARLSEAKRGRGKALVEERARRICHVPGDSVGHWARYEPIVVDEAREQLRREGKL